MSSESVYQVARSWVDVGSFHKGLMVRFMIFTAAVRNILDTPSYYYHSFHAFTCSAISFTTMISGEYERFEYSSLRNILEPRFKRFPVHRGNVLRNATYCPRMAVAYLWGDGGCKTPPPPKFRCFDKAEPNSQFRGKYIRNNLMFHSLAN
jgi:hypothetical protein